MWSDVELLTNEDTNSYRFGHVSKEENGSGLYQVDTLVKISTADAPYLYSSCGSNWSVVVADRTVILFDQTYQTILLHLDFETEVDAVDVCLEGQFLVVCERVGNLHLIYVPQKRILLTRVCMRALYMWTYNYGGGAKSDLYSRHRGDVLSLWDLHFLVMIWFSPDDPIQDFLLSTGLKVLNVLSVTLSIYSLTEAEKFAITFELDLELVYKVKLDFVLEQLASASVGGYGQDVWSELVEGAKSNLTKIADEQYVVEYCLKAPWPTFQTAEKMLGHAAERFSSLHIQEAQARLATFCSLHGPQNFNGISWIEFLNSTDNMAEVQCQLREGDLKGAQLLWLRHEIAEKVDEAALEALLGAIPEDLPSGELCPWFRNVLVPFVRRVLPQGQKALARWLEQKARNLELTEKGAWPLNGLEMAELGLPSLWMWMQSDNDYGAEEVANLRSLVVNLRQLLDLHRKYKCRLSLSVFEKGSARSLAFFMLDKITAPEVIPQTVEKSVRPYALEQQIPLDQLLLHYIKDLLERCRSQTTSLFTNWESKAVAVLDCMTETDLKVDAVLEVMQNAVVPWSDVVEKLVQKYLEMEGPKQKLLKESYHLMEITKLLRGYGIRNFNLSNNTNVMALIRYILRQNLSTSLEDSLKLAVTYKLPTFQIHYLYLTELIAQGKVGPRPVQHTGTHHRCWLMLNGLHLYSAFIQSEDFDVFFTPANYEDPAMRQQIQEHHIMAYENTRGCRQPGGPLPDPPTLAKDPDGKSKSVSTQAGLGRLGRQLQRTKQELWSDLALRALGVGKVEVALKILGELYEHHGDPGTGKVLFTAAQRLCQMLEADTPMVVPDGSDLPALIHNLASRAITVCHPDLLLDCLELCKSTRIAMDVYHQCLFSDNYGFIAKAKGDPYSQWTFQDLFREDCIVLDEVSVLPVQYEITNGLLPMSPGKSVRVWWCSSYLQPLLGPLNNMLQMLQECSQLELALRVLVNSYCSCLQHVTSNIMDVKLSTKVLQYNTLMTEVRKSTIATLNNVAVALLNKVFKWGVLDCDLAIGLCTLLSKTEVFKLLWKVVDNTWQNYDKIMAVAVVGAQLCHLYQDKPEEEKFLSVITDAEWGIKLGKLGVSSRNAVLNPLHRCFCSDLVSFVVTQKVWAPNCSLVKSTAWLHVVCVWRPLPPTLPLCLKPSSSRSVSQLNPYCYERIEVVLKIIQTADENVTCFSVSQYVSLLKHLQSYRRIGPPTDLESSYLLENCLQPSALAQSRLPFHMLMHPTHYWKIIAPELSEETFPTILLISKLMKVSLDKLYMLAVNNVFEKSLKPLLLRQSGRGPRPGRHSFEVAKTIMDYIRCIQNPEWAAATAHKITQELPPGNEKAQSLRFCLSLAETWLKDPKIETFLSKLKLQFQRSATENALLGAQLGGQELLKLTGLPAKLIAALYEHPSVAQRYRDSAGDGYPDLHAVCKGIATINNVDLLKIRNLLLEKWICRTGPAGAKVCLSVCVCVCVCAHANSTTHARMHTLTQVPMHSLCVCISVCVVLSSYRYYLRCFIYVSQLEALNISYTIEAFLSSPKEGMVKGLWKNHSHEPQAVRLVADLCLEYQVYDPQLWKGLLQKLLAFSMISHLQKVLEAICAVPSLWQVSVFQMLVQQALTHVPPPVSSASVPLSPDQQATLCRTFVLLLKCPFLLNMDLIGIANRFAQFTLPAFALGTLLLIPCDLKKEKQIQGFLSACNPLAILEQVEELMTTGEMAGIPSQVTHPSQPPQCPLFL
uniref:Kinetochore associated 1 n=1 Tax=Gadus morhua TaxID=8049 RepID=A0A8C5AK64_GADMO